MPKVTIGITTYNAASTLATAVHSAYAQTHHDIEVLVVDDASTDGTPALLEELQIEYPALRTIIHKKNQGVATARNTIINAAHGEFIAFFDDDDTSDPTRVEKQLDAILAAEKNQWANMLVVCHTARTQIYPSGENIYCPTQVGTPPPQGKAVALRILVGKPLLGCAHGAMATCSQMARTETYKKLSGFDAALRRSEDTDFNIRLALAEGVFVGLAEPLVKQAMTLRQGKSWMDEHMFTVMLLKKYDTLLTHEGFTPFVYAWADLKLAFLEGDYTTCLRRALALLWRHPWLTLRRLSWAFPNALDNLKIGRFRRGLNGL